MILLLRAKRGVGGHGRTTKDLLVLLVLKSSEEGEHKHIFVRLL